MLIMQYYILVFSAYNIRKKQSYFENQTTIGCAVLSNFRINCTTFFLESEKVCYLRCDQAPKLTPENRVAQGIRYSPFTPGEEGHVDGSDFDPEPTEPQSTLHQPQGVTEIKDSSPQEMPNYQTKTVTSNTNLELKITTALALTPDAAKNLFSGKTSKKNLSHLITVINSTTLAPTRDTTRAQPKEKTETTTVTLALTTDAAEDSGKGKTETTTKTVAPATDVAMDLPKGKTEITTTTLVPTTNAVEDPRKEEFETTTMTLAPTTDAGKDPRKGKTETTTMTLASTRGTFKNPPKGKETTTETLAPRTDATKDPPKVTIETTTATLAPTTGAAEDPRKEKTVRSSHGTVCKRKHDCRIQKSQCYNAVCLCKIGFYFSPKENACLRACKEYGDGMDIYKGACIKAHNDKAMDNTTLTSCLNFCVQETAFTCLTVDWSNNGRCYLQKNGYRDVIFWDREKGDPDFTLGQRRCK